jgi:hypothetical protein
MESVTDDPDPFICARIIALNAGGSDARVTDVRANITRRRIPIQPPEIVVSIDGFNGPMEIGARHNIPVTSIYREGETRRSQPVAVSVDDPSVIPGLTDIYLIGLIVYENARQRRMETGFCRRFNYMTLRWEPVPNSPNEYAY